MYELLGFYFRSLHSRAQTPVISLSEAGVREEHPACSSRVRNTGLSLREDTHSYLNNVDEKLSRDGEPQQLCVCFHSFYTLLLSELLKT